LTGFDLGITEVDLVGVFFGQTQHGSIARGFERIASGNLFARNLAKLDDGSVCENYRLLQHVLDGGSVQHAASAAGVVSHHAAYRRPARGRNIGCETQTQRGELCV
jgi:hypothetical protein